MTDKREVSRMGAELRRLRGDVGLRELSAKCGLSQSAISKIENGLEGAPLNDKLIRYARALGVSPTWILRGSFRLFCNRSDRRELWAYLEKLFRVDDEAPSFRVYIHGDDELGFLRDLCASICEEGYNIERIDQNIERVEQRERRAALDSSQADARVATIHIWMRIQRRNILKRQLAEHDLEGERLEAAIRAGLERWQVDLVQVM